MTKSEQMARVRSKDTAPELLVRRALTDRGVRYRLHRKDLPGRPDIYIGRLRTAIFVNGCFWHGHECRRGKRPSSNIEFWNTKIERNRKRDADVSAKLSELGIEALTVWQCAVKDFANTSAADVAARYRSAG